MSRTYGLRALPTPPMVTFASRCSLGMVRSISGAAATGVSPWSNAANALLAFPFVLEAPTTFYRGFWVNGSAAGGNSEVGIWDEDYNKICTTGSVAGSGNSVPQSTAFTGGVFGSYGLPPGLYYAGMAHDATTTNQLFRWSVATHGAAAWQAEGCWREAGVTLGSLAATATPGDMTNIAFPLFGLITRADYTV
jgi:hypothetical protein